MPIQIGTSTKNQQEIVWNSKSMSKVYVGDKLVWQKVVSGLGFGKLYNWYAGTNANNIAASGWHVPTIQDKEDLRTYINDLSNDGTKLKNSSLIYWDNSDGTDVYGFNGIGGGSRDALTGAFSNIKRQGLYMTSDVFLSIYFVNLGLNYSANNIQNYAERFAEGVSIRLIKDGTDPSLTTYTGNDGTVYNTVKIGTQVWMAENLKETKYRDNSDIPEVTDASTWAGLTSGAFCWYDNDPSYD